MKDLARHLKKLNRKILRSFYREELENMNLKEKSAPQEEMRQPTKKTKKKADLKDRLHRSHQPTAAEKNKKMKKRVPVFDRINNAKPRHTKASQKKTPRI